MPNGDGTGPDGTYNNCKSKNGQPMYGNKKFGRGQGRGKGYRRGSREGPKYGFDDFDPQDKGSGQQEYQPKNNTLEMVLTKILDTLEKIFEKPDKEE